MKTRGHSLNMLAGNMAVVIPVQDAALLYLFIHCLIL